MNSTIGLGLWLAGLWTASVAIAYGITKVVRRKPAKPTFLVDANWRIRTQEGAFRVCFLGVTSKGYVISAPMSQDSYVPLRPGERVHVEAPGAGVMLTFRTYIIGRNAADHTLVLQETEDFVVREQRQDIRLRFADGEPVLINDEPSVLMDMSQTGAKIRTQANVATGDWVKLDLPDEAPKYACVLEVIPDSLDGRPANGVRVVFAEPK